MWRLMSLIGCVTANLWGNPLPLRSYRWTIMECTPTQEWAGQTDLETVFTRSGPRRRLKQTRGNASVYYGVEADGRISTRQPAGGRYLAPSVPARCPPAPSATRRSRWGSPPTGCYSAAPPRFSAAAPPGATGQRSWASSRDFPSAFTRVSCGSVGCLPHTWPSAAAAGHPPSQSHLHPTSDWCFPSPLPARTASKQRLFIFYSCCAELPWRHNSQPIPLIELLLC